MRKRISDWIYAPVVTRVEQTLQHPAHKLHHILLDFQEHHLRISPFTLIRSSYRMIEGGVGEGTVLTLASRLTGGRALIYRVDLLPGDRTFELRSDDGSIIHRFEVVAEGEHAARVILSVHSTVYAGWPQVIGRLRTLVQERRLINEKIDNLDRYAATFGNRVMHAAVTEGADQTP